MYQSYVEKGDPSQEVIHWKEARKVVEAMKEALAYIHENYSNPELSYQEYLDYHNERHTEAVIRRARRIIGALRDVGITFSREEKGVVMVAAAFHDSVQLWYAGYDQQPTHSVAKRIRFGGFNPEGDIDESKGNEYLSARMAVDYIRKLDMYTSKIDNLVQEIIKCTVSSWNEEFETVDQRFLTSHSSMLAWIVALADMGNLGMENPEVFIQEGDALFREENLFIKTYLYGDDPHNNELEQIAVKTMQNWSQRQVEFAKRRKKLFLKRLEEMPTEEKGREAVKSLFSHFDETIAKAKEVAHQRSTMSFEDLVKHMGYSK